MTLELSQLHQLAYGRSTEVEVGSLPHELAVSLRCHPAIVWLRKPTFVKILRGHGEDVRLEEFLQLPFLLARGRYFQEPQRPGNNLTVFYDLPANGRLYVAGIEWTHSGSEVWVQTFFHIDRRKAERRQAKATLIHQGR